MDGAGGNKSCGHFWKHRESALNIASQLDINTQDFDCGLWVNDITTIKVLENTLTKNRRMKIENVTNWTITLERYV